MPRRFLHPGVLQVPLFGKRGFNGRFSRLFKPLGGLGRTACFRRHPLPLGGPGLGRLLHRFGKDLHGPLAFLPGDLLADELFNGLEILHFVDTAKADGHAFVSRPARAADAVDVGFRLMGQIVIKHVRQPRNVDTTGGDVGGDEHVDLALLELGQGLLPGSLTLVPMDGPGLNALPAQLPHHPVRAVLGAGKDQRAFHLRAAQKVGQQVLLVGLIHQIQVLLDGVHGAADRVYLHADRVFEDAHGQLFHLGGHGGGEEKRLPLFRQKGDDFFHIVDEAHVQHPISLVQHKNLNFGKADKALTDQVVQPSGRSHQNVYAPLELLHLRLLAYAAENHTGAQRHLFAVGHKVFLNLQGQFPGGGQDQRPNIPSFPGGPLLIKPLQNRQGEGGGLAGARLGAAQHVFARKNGGNRIPLNGGGGLIAAGFNRGQQLRKQRQFVKIQKTVSFLSHSNQRGSVTHGAALHGFLPGIERKQRFPGLIGFRRFHEKTVLSCYKGDASHSCHFFRENAHGAPALRAPPPGKRRCP